MEHIYIYIYIDYWSVNKLLTVCLQEEERLKHENEEIANFVTHEVKKRQNKKDKGVVEEERKSVIKRT